MTNTAASVLGTSKPRSIGEFGGTWALVTGASSGLGEVFARKLAHRGANLILAARSGDRLGRLATDLARVGGVEARSVAVDLSEPEGVRTLLDAVGEMGVFVEHLFNNAGFGSAGAFSEPSGERERAMVRLNAEAVVALSHALLGPMLAAGRGGIVNVASTAAFQPVPYMATYAASKAFVLSFTLSLARETADKGVRVMALCPGPVKTGFQEAAGISRPGLRIAELGAEETVERALDAYARGEVFYVPGFVNGAQSVAAKLLPRGFLSWLTVKAMRRLGRGD